MKDDAQVLYNGRLLLAARVLQWVSARSRPVALAEICREVELPRPTVFKLLLALEQVDLVGRSADGRHYGKADCLSPDACAALLNGPASESRRDVLLQLVEKVGYTCNLTVLNGNSVTYLDRIEEKWPIASRFYAGASLPLYASACGKLFLSQMDIVSREKYLRHSPLVQITAHTVTNPARLKAECEAIRQQGWALDNEEYLSGVGCLAVPVANPAGKVVAAIGLHWGLADMETSIALKYLPLMNQAAGAIGQTIDW